MTPLVHRLGTNPRGRDFVVGSVLGERERLMQALAAVDFDVEADRLLSTGNLIDCGPDSCGVLLLTEEPWFFSVRGVREERMLSVLDHHERPMDIVRRLGLDGSEWINRLDPEQRAEVQALLRALPIALSVGRAEEQCVVVHGETPTGLDWTRGSEQNAELYLASTRHRIAAVHGHRRLMAARRAERLGAHPPQALARVQGCRVAVHARDASPRARILGNQCYLPPLTASRRVWMLGADLIDTLSDDMHGRQSHLPTRIEGPAEPACAAAESV